MFAGIQQAVFDRLVPALAPVKVWDYVPEGSPLPYVTFASPWSAERDQLCAIVERVWFQISTWSEYRGYKEADEIDAVVLAALRGQTLSLPDGGWFQVLGDNAHAMRDVDPRIRQVARTFFVPYFFIAPSGIPA